MKELDFLAAAKRSDVAQFREIYASIVEQMENQMMPPKDFKQPTDNERLRVTKWIKETLDLKPADFDRISAYVVDCFEDKKGNIWFGCLSSDHPEYVDEGGLIRCDGANSTQFPEVKGLAANDIYSLYTTKAGEIWIGATGVGAYRYDGNLFTLFDKTDRKFWTRHFGVQSIMEDRKGTMWFGFSGGLFRFNGRSFVNVTKKGQW